MMRGVDASTVAAVAVGVGAVLTSVGHVVAQVRREVLEHEREHGLGRFDAERMRAHAEHVVAQARRELAMPPQARPGSRWRLGMAYARAMARQAVDDLIGWDADAVSAQQRREDVVEVGELEG